MKAEQSVIFFGDQTVDTYSHIRLLSHAARNSPALARFLRCAADIVQLNLLDLPSEEKGPYADFETILELSELYHAQTLPYETIATVLWVVSQVGDLIIQAEGDPSLLEKRDHPVLVIGLCTGMLSAATFAAARDINDLVRLGQEIIGVAFRVGLAQWRRAVEIERNPGRWGVAVINVPPKQLQTIIDGFNGDMVGMLMAELFDLQAIPRHRHIYISFVAHNWAVLSGPPSLFPELWSYSPTLQSTPKKNLELGTPAHAAHLQPLDVDAIASVADMRHSSIRENTLLLSTSSCKPFECGTFGDILRHCVRDITGATLDFAGVINYCTATLHHDTPVKVVPLGPPSQVAAFHKALEGSGFRVSIRDPTPQVISTGFRDGSDLIAIVGQSARLPGSEDLDTLWENLLAKKTFEQKIPKSRFDLAVHYDATGARRSTVTTQYGNFLANPGLFDSRLFRISPREAMQMDPVQRLLMMCTHEALQMAGYTPDASLSTNRMRIATYFGQTSDDWREANASQNVDIYYIPGTTRSFAPGRLNYHYKWGGGHYVVDSACASSTTAILMAYRALLARECDTAVAGGGQLFTSPAPYAGLSRAGFLSKTPGGCKTFRDDADGYCRGEGVGVVVLKRLEDALADNDNILAVVRGGGRNYSCDASSITHPSASAQIRLMRHVLRTSGVEADEIGFVEMHGTGTQAGDAVEMESVLNIFGTRPADNPLYVGSLKANIGHGEAVSGIASLIKCVETLRRGTIPPQAGFPGPLNPKFSHIDTMNIRIPTQPVSFKLTANGKRTIAINNFDASGGNNCLLIGDPPSRDSERTEDPRGFHTVIVSAATLASLKKNIANLLEHMEKYPGILLADLAYTTTARRTHEDLKRAYSVSTTAELRGLLAADLGKDSISTPISKAPSVVFTFTGQGSQYAGMGKELFATSICFRRRVVALHDRCVWHGFEPFIDLIIADGSEANAASPVQIQLAIVVLEMALVDLWRSWDVRPSAVIGYSLGEYVALYAAGVLSAQDTLFLVGYRAKMIKEKCVPHSHAMVAIQATLEDTKKLLESASDCEIACISAPRSTVVSGSTGAIESLKNTLQAMGTRVKYTQLEVTYGFHSPQIDPILSDLRELAEGVVFNKPRIPVASALLGRIVEEEGIFTPSYAMRHAREAVNFVDALNACWSTGLADSQTIWIEIGPKPVLTGLVGSTLSVERSKLICTINDKDNNWNSISKATTGAFMAGLPMNWVKYHRDFSKHVRLLELPSYAFDLQEYWITNETPPYTGKQYSTSPSAHVPGGPAVPGFPTSAVQMVRAESSTGNEISVTFESAVASPALLAAIHGHRINGVPLCPASVFMDMAYTVANYMQHRFATSSSAQLPSVSLTDLNITRPLIPNPDHAVQKIIIQATMKTGDTTVHVRFHSEGGIDHHHEYGTCKLHFEDSKAWTSEWSEAEYFINVAKDSVLQNSISGRGHHLQQSVAYKLFANLVTYSDDFQSMKEVFVPKSFCGDAVAMVQLKPSAGDFTLSPYWADSLVHVAGFLLNGRPEIDNGQFYIASGLGETRVLRDRLRAGGLYTSFAHVDDISDKGVARCQVYVFEGSEIIASCKNIMFQRMSRRVIEVIIGGKGRSSSQARGKRATESAGHAHFQPLYATERDPVTSSPSFNSSSYSSTLLTAPTELGESLALSAPRANHESVVEIILARTGYDGADVTDSTNLLEVGLDSLLTIEILSDIQKALGLDLPATFFIQNQTLGEIRNALGAQAHSPNILMDDPTVFIQGRALKSEQDSTPDDFVDSGVLDIVLAQTGFARADVTPFTSFADMGLDSLSIIEVVELVRQNFDLDLPASFFFANPTVADLGKALSAPHTKSPGQNPPGNNAGISALKPPSPRHNALPEIDRPMKSLTSYSSRVVLIQGSRKSKGIPLFLIVDGLGSVTSYLNLPPLFEGDNPVFACESPFILVPEEFHCSIDEASDMYAAAIRKTCPHGPYLIGGWSLGALYAFETAKRLRDTGEVVHGLFLLDFKISMSIDTSMQTEPTMEMVEMLGVTNGLDVPARNFCLDPMPWRTKVHCLQAMRSVAKHNAKPMGPSQRPVKTFVLWAGMGLENLLGYIPPGIQAVMRKEQEAAANQEANKAFTMLLWFFGKRNEHEGPDGWDAVTGGPVECVTLPCDHFSMVHKSFATTTGAHLKRMITQCL
ncbi:uncharacterized protein Triagg1_10293 [Trichoderma aggressivum f. europaeum]|uniref:Polyketide synthase n=1 Tax=Trichoderma aggressivum f. europaeum TaxID=173218 RepID=A0AAE1LYA0_9HYPO|nr:hypothetical protein Triagg1_10293 [Trichoderma aggressivum f. europaeum]